MVVADADTRSIHHGHYIVLLKVRYGWNASAPNALIMKNIL
jgi:hypothetical protein